MVEHLDHLRLQLRDAWVGKSEEDHRRGADAELEADQLEVIDETPRCLRRCCDRLDGPVAIALDQEQHGPPE